MHENMTAKEVKSELGFKTGVVSGLNTGDVRVIRIVFVPKPNNLFGEPVVVLCFFTLPITSYDNIMNVENRVKKNISQDSWVVVSKYVPCIPSTAYLGPSMLSKTGRSNWGDFNNISAHIMILEEWMYVFDYFNTTIVTQVPIEVDTIIGIL